MSLSPAVDADGCQKTVSKRQVRMIAIGGATGRTTLSSSVEGGLCGVNIWAHARLDEALRFVDADPMFRQVLGEAVAGRRLDSVLHPGFAEPLRARLAELVAGPVNRMTCHTVLLRRDDAPVIVEATAVSLTSLRGPACVALAVRPEEGRRTSGPRSGPVRLSELSARILEHVAAGMSSAQLARTLFLSKQGVEYHVTSLVRKLGAPNRTGMVSMAYAAGVLLARQWPPKVNPALID